MNSLELAKTSKIEISQLLKYEAAILGAITSIFGLNIDKNLPPILFHLIKKILGQLFHEKFNGWINKTISILDLSDTIKLTSSTYIDVLKSKKTAELEKKEIAPNELIKLSNEKFNYYQNVLTKHHELPDMDKKLESQYGKGNTSKG